MALEFAGGAWWPERRTWALGSPIVNVTSPYSLGIPIKRHGIVIRAPHTGTLTGYGVTLGGISGSSGFAVQFSIQGVDAATGTPDGTNQVNTPLLSSDWPVHSWYRADMTGTYDVTCGDLVALTMEFTEEGISSAAFWTCLQQPQNVQGPPWRCAWTVADGWTLGPGAPYMPAGVVLFYDDDSLSGPPDGLMPAAVTARCSVALSTVGPVGMGVTVPRSLRCIGLSVHHRPLSGTTLTLYEDGVAVRAGEIAARADYGDRAMAFDELTLRPGRTYRVEATASAAFEIKGYRSVLGPAGTSPPTAPANIPDTWPGIAGLCDDFEGGPTWLGDGDIAASYAVASWGSAPPLVDRWFMSLHILGDAEELPPSASLVTALPRCVVIPVCPEEEEPGPPAVTPTVFAPWQPGRGPLRLRARRRS